MRIVRVVNVETEAERQWKRAHGIETVAEYEARHRRMSEAARAGMYAGRDGRLHDHKETPAEYRLRKLFGIKRGW